MSNDVEVNVFDRALQLAGKSSMNQKHGAVILGRNGEIIGEGFNHFSSFMCHSWSCHAEIAALLSIKNKKEKLVDATLVVVRLGSDNEPKLSKPCDKCRKEINKFGIKKVFYST